MSLHETLKLISESELTILKWMGNVSTRTELQIKTNSLMIGESLKQLY
jgi:hypothetical protein